ncbi:phosphonate transport system permease protein [Humitalea rosea]|uniref:Phosphonate transport system permease protein n=1 Tax=Humitalea rosea TaxID=990373 RepID=A0A2W7HVJ9_9PROT|nr:phosphonate ABC transporter, permease protein PhnE [Humitalea rosea]PZW38524.1 phosphonate transport system permease protein [Humitalea rosea]
MTRTQGLFGGGFLLLLLGLWRVDASPLRVWNGLERLGWLFRLMWPPTPAGALPDLLLSLGQTLAMAFLGTLIASLVALPLCLLGANNVVTSTLLRFSARRVFDGLRGVDTLIWALIFVSAVGMGPFAGILALAIPDIGTLAKTFSEAIEATDRRQVEAIRAAGGGRLAAVRFGLLPQVLPAILSQSLYTLESNTRSATILGVVGAGGIGLALADRIRINNWDEVAFIVLLILATVAAMDATSRRLRLAVIRA